MISFKEKLTEEEIDLLDIGVYNALIYKAERGETNVLSIVDKIDWSSDIDMLKFLYYKFYNSLTERNRWDERDIIEERLTKLIDIPLDEHLKKVDLLTDYKRKEY